MRRFLVRPAIRVVIVIAVAGSIPAVLLLSDDDSPNPVASQTGTPFFGVNDAFLYLSLQMGQEELVRSEVQQMAEAGIEWVRLATSWHGEEPNVPVGDAHTYNWFFLDAIVSILAENRLPMELTLYSTPNWAAESPQELAACGLKVPPAPTAVGSFADYAAAVARRYGSGGDFWVEHADLPRAPLRGLEIWNEPNWDGFWCPEPKPEAYADLFVAAAKAIRAVDPNIRIVTGGLTGVFEDDVGSVERGMDANLFMQRAVEHRPEISKLAAAIGFHPYAADVAGVMERVGRFREGLEATGLGDVPIEISETGWPTQGTAYAVSESTRADLVADLADKAWRSSCNVDGLALYAWRTPESAPGVSDLWYGIADSATGEPYESGRAYANEIAELRSAGKPDSLSPASC